MANQLRKQFREFVARERLFTKESRLLMACSGGLDSTVLAHLLHAEGYDFAVAHMNFQLRGEASNGDAAFVEELARTLGAKFYCKAVDVKKQTRPGESTQMTARRLRYEWFQEADTAPGYNFLLTAHHAQDNFETVLMHLIRGTGMNGLTGIKAFTGIGARPLLRSDRADIRKYALENNIGWREDASNATDDYLRNRIRHHLTPVFYEEFGLTVSGINRTMDNLNGEYHFMRQGLAAINKEACTHNRLRTTINRRKFRDESHLKTFLFHRFEASFTNDQLDQLVSSGRNLQLRGRSCTAYSDPEEINIIQDNLPRSRPSKKITITELPFDEFIFDQSTRLKFAPRPADLNEPGQLFLAPQNLPLHLRPRQNGDRFQPLGLGGKTKKVKDYFIDEKVPVWLRDRIYLLTNADDEIMAIPGYCISEQFKVLPEHETVLRITTS